MPEPSRTDREREHTEREGNVFGEVEVTDDAYDAPDGAVIEFEDGITRERIADAWYPRPSTERQEPRHG